MEKVRRTALGWGREAKDQHNVRVFVFIKLFLALQIQKQNPKLWAWFLSSCSFTAYKLLFYLQAPYKEEVKEKYRREQVNPAALYTLHYARW